MFQYRNFHSGHLHSETLEDSKSALLRWGDVCALAGDTSVQSCRGVALLDECQVSTASAGFAQPRSTAYIALTNLQVTAW